ncbi:rodhanase family domain containing protein [Entamoeba histolytica HM-1:IMSS-B]|uniref:protein-tyrosine-phosphatase n=6 Tax=Entamoeba histolytica TaxID=5759 RepID=C4MAJ7_ENTH1|nr:rodhanase-like domain containing protein [Entamoeba histolytica HM-1:IMSS]EMD47486.1 rodhanase family protein, putative [Entamoeba histolytica KU27]EMH75664.1 rodhanase family domain containing protein [Entamoeba histolytica HM-1:IMSS-B]EMS11182.1 rodhanase family domain containing protein [Entamoeba histolytica HM-3:IMSS]ENY59805.1 rodhanase family domain containing protein [Entamoeba histolytica HM-1:IMSS-A]GAT98837.1 rodhanase-like domain containing protein [Entamoeba histolytica]|eukprot:XP_649073.2 rodhanase-like domain containing protein [Entamoeba histolytica HM-1:IMSS]
MKQVKPRRCMNNTEKTIKSQRLISALTFSSSFYESIQPSSEKVQFYTSQKIERSKSAPKLFIEEKEEVYLINPFINAQHQPFYCSQEISTISVENFLKYLTKNNIVVDCRYPYEYEGGHVIGALNLWNPGLLFEYLKNNLEQILRMQSIIIFYCEFSKTRAPSLARQLRRFDLVRNKQSCFKEVYLLEGGFNELYSLNPSCIEGSYVEMNDYRYSERMLLYYKICTNYKIVNKLNCLLFS